MTETPLNPCNISDDDLPWAYVAANHAAIHAQKYYSRLISIDLLLLLFAALISIYSFSDPVTKTIVVCLRALLLFGSLFLSLLLQREHPEREWYDTRWLAETMLTEAWFYMTCAGSYPSPSEATDQSDNDFLAKQEGYWNQRSTVSSLLGGQFSDNASISPKMLEARRLPVEQRRDLYVNCRLKVQLRWYGEKSGLNREAERKWFRAIISAQICAFVYAIALIPATLSTQWISSWNVTGLFAAIASASLAWMQIKQFRHLARSYGMVEQKLKNQDHKGKDQMTETELCAFVTDTENIIQAEYTAWYARRSEG